MTIRIPDPKANTTAEAYLAYKAGYLEESELKPKLYKPDWHFDGWLAYWTGLTDTYPTKENGDPEMLTDEEALVAYLSGVTDTYPEEIKDPYDPRIVGYLRHIASIRFDAPDYPVNNEEFYLSTMEPTHTSNPEPSSDIELDTAEGKIISVEAYGDTTQQTYSGVNLYNVEDTQQVSTEVSVDSDGWITMQYDNSDGSATKYLLYYNKPMHLEADTDYAIVTEIKSIKSSADYLTVYDSAAQTQFNNSQTYNFSGSGAVSPGTYVSIGHTKADMSSATIGLRTFLRIGVGVNQAVTFRISVLANTSITPATFVYQPYVGGVPSPNPDYPQTVNVVTGEQTVTIMDDNNLWPATPYKENYYIPASGTEAPLSNFSIFGNISSLPQKKYVISAYNPESWEATLRIHAYDSNGNWIEQIGGFTIPSHETGTITFTTPTNTAILRWSFPTNASSTTLYQFQSYTIDLGATELCIIDTYQDKIFNNDPTKEWYNPNLEDNAWYVHKETGNVTLTGSETDWLTRVNTSTKTAFSHVIDDIESYTDTDAVPNLVSNRYLPKSYNQTWLKGDISRWASGNYIVLVMQAGLSVDDFKTWLSSNNTDVYYVLDTPTDTKITDATLLEQLDALAGADTYNRKTLIQVTANDPNLPALLKVEAYKY